MSRVIWMITAAIGVLGPLIASRGASNVGGQEELLKTREAVWRAWFAGDTKALETLVPANAIAISAGDEKWHMQAEILQSAAQFRAEGGKLTRLEFPRTETQRFGDVAVLYSQYLFETEVGGKRSLKSGRVTEVFVFRDGRWTNPGWHTDSEK